MSCPVNKADLAALAPDGDGWAFYSAHVFPQAEDTWEDGVPPEGFVTDAPEEETDDVWAQGFAPEGFFNVYLWRCLHCGIYRITYDCE